MTGDTIVRNTNRHPNGSPASGALADQVQNPCFIGIGNRKRFSTTIISIFFYKSGHYLYSFACGFRPFKCKLHQRAIIDNACRIDQFGTTTPCRFHNSKLMFVHIAHHGVGMFYLFYFSQWFIRIPLYNRTHRAFWPIGSRRRSQSSVQSMRVCLTRGCNIAISTNPFNACLKSFANSLSSNLVFFAAVCKSIPRNEQRISLL